MVSARRDDSLISIDAYARETSLRRRSRMRGSATQASRANQAWSARQIGQRVREKNTALRAKLSRSVVMPVGIGCPVCGHFTMTIPMSPSLEIIFCCRLQ